jgi:DNA-directed RNA polymerase specialized sigma24 family protein
MPAGDHSDLPGFQAAGRFASTHWSMVLAAGQRDSPDSDQALATLCRVYWYPLYAYARRRFDRPDEAQDLTQGFFAELLEKEYLQAVDPQRGKFRSFLLTAFKHYLAKERDRAAALKRGGGRRTVALDFQAGESRYLLEPADHVTAEVIYERRWALTLLDQALIRLRQEFTSAGKVGLFEGLKQALTGDGQMKSHAQIAVDLDMTENAVKVAVHRLRKRYQEVLRAVIGETVASPDEIEGELRDLFAAVRARNSGKV